MKLFLKTVLVVSLVYLFNACKAIPPLISVPDPYESTKDIAIFIDGTAFTPKDSSNITKLRNNLKDRKDILSFYTVGVGAGPDAKRVGQFMGVGLSKDVQEAYRFICLNYSKTRQDRIHLFGFSRGAYTCKIITNLIRVAGIIDLSTIPDDKTQIKLIRKLYKTYLSKKAASERQADINAYIIEWQNKHATTLKRRMDVSIETLNLFDTVEALGAPDQSFNPCCPNNNHLDQFVNVNYVNHAVSIDDNRARIFTPVLATCPCIEKPKDQTSFTDFVNEVWFAGAHSDVGGGYRDAKGNLEDKLSYIPLNWMQQQLVPYDLFDNTIPTDDTHIKAKVHDAQLPYGAAFLRRNRQLEPYHRKTIAYNNGRMKIHKSVIERLALGIIPKFKQYERKRDKRKNIIVKDWYEVSPFNACFEKVDATFIYKPSCNLIEIID